MTTLMMDAHEQEKRLLAAQDRIALALAARASPARCVAPLSAPFARHHKEEQAKFVKSETSINVE